MVFLCVLSGAFTLAWSIAYDNIKNKTISAERNLQEETMFGYVTIQEAELKVKDFKKYKAYYCGLCQTLKKNYGSLGQITLTYDMTFAIVLLTSLYESETMMSKHRCKIHPVKKQKLTGRGAKRMHRKVYPHRDCHGTVELIQAGTHFKPSDHIHGNHMNASHRTDKFFLLHPSLPLPLFPSLFLFTLSIRTSLK